MDDCVTTHDTLNFDFDFSRFDVNRTGRVLMVQTDRQSDWFMRTPLSVQHFCFLLSNLEVIAWSPLNMNMWKMTYLHNTNAVGLCYQQFQWQGRHSWVLSHFSFAATLPLCRLSPISHSISSALGHFSLSRPTHTLPSLLMQSVLSLFPIRHNCSGNASAAGAASHCWMYGCTVVCVCFFFFLLKCHHHRRVQRSSW